MALVDWEAVVLDLEAYVEGKDGRSFGQREITDKLRELRVRHRITEGLPEKALRLYGPNLIDILHRRPAAPDPEVSGGMDEGATHRIAGDAPHEGDTPSGRHPHEARVAA